MIAQWKKLTVSLLAALLISALFIASSEASIVYTPEQKKDLGFEIARELRCPMSVNQSLFDSNAQIANELKGHIFRLLNEGKSKNEIIDYLVQRYGEKIRYSPDLSGDTALLWFGPALLLIGGIGGCVLFIRRSRRAA
ncbi:MAG: cytochrome c-type biogenesis protein CcmH [Shewanella sp.]|nr:cytochrome c-type biogenesis protein CcmH [Shewanella sp.]MCF1431886.1 cytochrome c-type biogenesis protein CcmH [Shewanella sp.]MCF1438165.1 cytochrome c-type biogenesis protein CcmH [Shewanella sp.]MCF1458859.1 cytochrome c-type biogenesis protein CcmH [Shewanella sp.]